MYKIQFDLDITHAIEQKPDMSLITTDAIVDIHIVPTNAMGEAICYG